MSVRMHRYRCRLLLIFALAFCLMPASTAMAVHLKDDLHTGIGDYPFSILILGDSQMAGAGWEGGYANCIEEAYPNAQVLNLAQNGSLLARGDIHAQLELCLTEDVPAFDFVLLDGGTNDMPYVCKGEFAEAGLELLAEALSSLIEEIHEANPDARIIFTLMPPLVEWEDAKKGPPSYEIQERYWKRMNRIAGLYDYVTVLDLFSINPFHFPCAECYHEYFADSIHLSEAGYRKTFEYIDNIFMAHLAKMLDK